MAALSEILASPVGLESPPWQPGEGEHLALLDARRPLGKSLRPDDPFQGLRQSEFPRMGADPDLPVLQALQAGDDAALEVLIRRHQKRLLRFVHRYLKDMTAAHDVVEETFVRVYFNEYAFEARALVKTWIYQIALNLCHTQARQRSRRCGEFSLDGPLPGDFTLAELVDPQLGPAARANQSDRFATFQALLDQMPPPLREVLEILLLDGRPTRVAAKMLGTTPDIVRVRAFRAKNVFLQLLLSGKGCSGIAKDDYERCAEFLEDFPNWQR